jgi:hypothetical protein
MITSAVQLRFFIEPLACYGFIHAGFLKTSLQAGKFIQILIFLRGLLLFTIEHSLEHSRSLHGHEILLCILCDTLSGRVVRLDCEFEKNGLVKTDVGIIHESRHKTEVTRATKSLTQFENSIVEGFFFYFLYRSHASLL